MSTQLYLIRHGQSEANLRDCFLGHGDLDLTDLGRRQAALTATYLQGIHADAISARLNYVAGQEGLDLTREGAALIARLSVALEDMRKAGKLRKTDNGFELHYVEDAGDHNWDYWDHHIRLALNWLPLDETKAGLNSGNIK